MALPGGRFSRSSFLQAPLNAGPRPGIQAQQLVVKGAQSENVKLLEKDAPRHQPVKC